VDTNDGRYAGCPRLQGIQLGFGKDDALHPRDKFGKRVNVHADCLTPGRKSFYEACPTADMWIED
jgi:hypothetical protein